MKKLDLKKDLKELYSAKNTPTLLLPQRQQIICIEGQGDPNTSKDFSNAIESLFPVAFKIKFMSKQHLDRDFVVMPLEGLWWADSMIDFSTDDKTTWKWKLLIVQPDFITKEIYMRAIDEVNKTKALPALSKVKFDSLNEGHSAQLLHVGPYSKEEASVKRLHEFIQNNGYTFDGLQQKHHEIYLSDARRTAPEKLKTIIRQPITLG